MPLQFAFTLFVSAFLLFLVQPMIAQMILPTLGGTPAVWNTCMVFFQAALLAGYGYTHSATTFMPTRRQVLVQMGLLVLPLILFMLPFGIGTWTPKTEVYPVWSVLYILLVTVGLPFMVVATTAPLLQRWFASTGHRSAKDPYFLYGASNLGSMLALVAYPFVFQPLFDLPDLALIWLGGYGLLIVLVGICALVAWRTPITPTLLDEKPEPPRAPAPVAQAKQHITRRAPRPVLKPPTPSQPALKVVDAPTHLTWLRRLRWVGLAAAPSSLMLGVTTFMTTDIAAIPLFWIVPLALYLLSFILVFARWPVPWTGNAHRFMLYAQPILLFNLGLAFVGRWNMDTVGSMLTRVASLLTKGEWTASPTAAMLIDHLLAYFVCVMVCHGELAKDRPAAKHLTEFYLWMSVGGVIGGIFNSLIAPLVFKEIIEYIIVLVLVVFLRPQTHFLDWIRRNKESPDDHGVEEYLLDIGYAVCLTLLGWGLLKLTLHQSLWKPSGDFTSWLVQLYARTFSMQERAFTWARWTELILIEGIPIGIALAFAGRPVRFGLAVVGLTIVNYFMLLHNPENCLYKNRSFFSVQSVYLDEPIKGGKLYRKLVHGGIDHGRQQVSDDPLERDRPISYFLPTNPIGQVFTKLKELDASMPPDKKLPFAVVGLGVGTLASYGNPGQVVHFYEIDPAVLRLSGLQLDSAGKLAPLADGSEPMFYYLHDALNRGVKLDLFLGDGRLKLKEEKTPGEKDNLYQVIVLDAFSSDAIPVHLLTKEAITMYLTKLRDDGILVFNITNRYVKMERALADVAKTLDLVCLLQHDEGEPNNPESFGTSWVIMFRNRGPQNAAALVGTPAAGNLSALPWNQILGAPKLDYPFVLPQLLDQSRWTRPEPTGRRPWTDHYQDLIRVMNW